MHWGGLIHQLRLRVVCLLPAPFPSMTRAAMNLSFGSKGQSVVIFAKLRRRPKAKTFYCATENQLTVSRAAGREVEYNNLLKTSWQSAGREVEYNNLLLFDRSQKTIHADRKINIISTMHPEERRNLRYPRRHYSAKHDLHHYIITATHSIASCADIIYSSSIYSSSSYALSSSSQSSKSSGFKGFSWLSIDDIILLSSSNEVGSTKFPGSVYSSIFRYFMT